jgi:3-deoxy-7-phosphoheptulonate synthase
MLDQDALYKRSYQPPYQDAAALSLAMHELRSTTPVTTPEQINEVQSMLSALALGEADGPLIITGRCAEPVDVRVPISTLVESGVTGYELVKSVMPAASVMQRSRGQNTKPRSSFIEKRPNGPVISYMGDAVNSTDLDRRLPDASRMVAAALQARDLENGLTAKIGRRVPAAHEALLLPYEFGFMRSEAGREYLLSADLPWIGERTRSLDGDHVSALRAIENPIGVKIGPKATAEDIAGLQRRLNPHNRPGKLTLMLRVGLGNAALTPLLRGIKEHAPNAVTMYDIHGVTKTAKDGTKIRAVEDIVQEVGELSAACGQMGLKLHGLHLETTTEDRLECVQTVTDRPKHPGGVDPQLNIKQTEQVLARTKHFLM